MTRRGLVCAVVALATYIHGGLAQAYDPSRYDYSGEATPPPPYASPRPMRTPTLFSAVLNSLEDASGPSFTPDGRTVYFSALRSAHGYMPKHNALMVSHYDGGEWSKPEILEFSGQHQEGIPTTSPDGVRLLFWSYRPLGDQGAPPKQDSDIWMVERSGSGWGAPRNLGQPVNSESRDYMGSIGRDGTLYLTSKRNGDERNGDIYCARLKDGRYMEPEHLGDAVNSSGIEFGPTISPDGQTLVFSSDRPGGLGSGICTSRAGRMDGGCPRRTWDRRSAVPLPNPPHVSHQMGGTSSSIAIGVAGLRFIRSKPPFCSKAPPRRSKRVLNSG